MKLCIFCSIYGLVISSIMVMDLSLSRKVMDGFWIWVMVCMRLMSILIMRVISRIGAAILVFVVSIRRRVLMMVVSFIWVFCVVVWLVSGY